MHRSPKLIQSENKALTAAQRSKLARKAKSAEIAADRLGALRAKRDSKKEDISAMRGHLGKIEAKLSAHPLTQQKEAKREEIEIARGDLQNIVDELARAQALLQSKIDAKNQVTAELKQEAANYFGGDDSDEDDVDGDDGDDN